MRFALRAAVRNPRFTALVVLSLAAGIGLTAALASVADAILYRPLPVDRPEEIVRVYTGSAGQTLGFVSFPDFEDFRVASRTLAGAVAQTQVLIAVGGENGAPPQVRMGLAVTPDYFDVLGVRPALGRGFIPKESSAAEVVLGHGFWESAFAADWKIIGRAIRVGGAAFTVIGVAPEGFGLDRFLHEDFYVPMGVYRVGLLPSTGRPLEDRAKRYLSVYGRLARGATLEQARAELTALAARLENAHPETDRGRRAVVFTEFQARLLGDRTMPVMAGLALVVGVLMLAIACSSVTSLVLMRAEARARETAIRVAMGATRARLLIENLTSSLILAILGGALAIPVAWAVTRMLANSARLPADLPFSLAVRIDPRVAGLAGIVCLMGICLTTRRPLKIAAGGRTRVMNTLVTIEIAVVAMLVASGGSILSGISSAARIDLGYRTDHVLVMALDPSQARYAEGQTRTFYRELLDRVRAFPGVAAAALAQSVPLGYSSAQREIVIGDHPALSVWINVVSQDYFRLMGMPIAEGRGFDERDTETSPPVMVVNHALDKLLNGAPVRLNGRKIEVIGVVRTAKYFQLTEAPRPYFYLPYSQTYASRMFLHVETEGDPASAAHALVNEVHRIDTGQPVSEVRALRDYSIKGAMLSARVAVDALGAVGLGGMLLALAGLYGVVSSATERRRREIAIRIALGASQLSVVILMLRQGMKLVTIGTACGLAAALGVSRFLTSLVAGTGKLDAWVLGFAALLVAAASFAACLIPACRAACTEPSVCLGSVS